MVALSLAHLGMGSPVGDLPHAAQPVQRAAFDEAMRRTGATPEPPAVQDIGQVAPEVTPPGPVPVAEPPGAGAAARERARRALDLDGTTAPREGDAILGGLQRLRGAFDGRHGRINEVMQSQGTDMNTLMSLQLEIAQYTLLVDVSSKLTGKATQSMDTLMKG